MILKKFCVNYVNTFADYYNVIKDVATKYLLVFESCAHLK